MAEPTTPTGDTRPAASREPRTEMLAPPTEEELSATGEPTADEIHAAAAGGTATPREPAASREPEPAAPREPEPAASLEPETAPAREAEPAASVASERPAQQVAPTPPPPPPPPAQQAVLAPAEESAPLPPVARGNRLAGVAWVLLAAGLFQVLFFGVNALVAFTFGGPSAAVPQLQQIAGTPLAWLPVVLLFLLYLLTVLLLNRAGRVAYVVGSLVVGVLVYAGTALLFLLIERQTLGDTNTLAQTFLNWEFIVIGLVAREVMLWTGIAVGSRGIRVRRRNTEARARYDAELADARD